MLQHGAMDGRRARQLGLAVALAVAALLWWWDPNAEVAQAPAPARPGEAGARALPPPPNAPAPAGTERAPSPGTDHSASAAESCSPRAELDCHEGDVYWFDSCGEPSERFEDCEQRGCDAARCNVAAAAPSDCGRTSAYGQCAGKVAEACIQGKLVRVDCALRRERCVMTSEGAACLPFDDKNGCRGDEPARCEGDRLKLCVDGVYQTIDCAARHARCSEHGAITQCELDPQLALPQLGGAPQEVCDNQDNDADGKIDEADACAEVPLVAFIPEGATLADHDVRMEQDLAILNQALAPNRFRWARVRKAPSNYRKFDPKDIELAAANLSQSESAFRSLVAQPLLPASGEDAKPLPFYIPVLYAEELKLQPPKSGLSTLPNARCGGVRVSDTPSPVSGIIVLTESRQPETLAHEMGHYLGLCHTHEQVAHFAVQTDGTADCERTGDSVCDTPFDPGPPSCFQSDPCELTCRDASRPNPFNIMSYYLGCRRVFTPEQLKEAARNLRLRRNWFRCQNALLCPCDPSHRSACPDEMSCRPSGPGDAPWLCGLDGSHLPGTPCEDSAQCANRAFCISAAQGGGARCVRPCEGEPDCASLDVGLPVPICQQDLGL